MPSLPAAEGWQGRFTCHAQRPPKKLLTLGTRFYVDHALPQVEHPSQLEELEHTSSVILQVL